MYLLSSNALRVSHRVWSLDRGHTQTTCERVPIWLARLCRVGGSRGWYTRMKRRDGIASRQKSSP